MMDSEMSKGEEDPKIIDEQTDAIRAAWNYYKFEGNIKSRAIMSGIMAVISVISLILILFAPCLTYKVNLSDLIGKGYNVEGETLFEVMSGLGNGSLWLFLPRILLIVGVVASIMIQIAEMVDFVKCFVNEDKYCLETYRTVKYNSLKRMRYSRGFMKSGQAVMTSAIYIMIGSITFLCIMISENYEALKELGIKQTASTGFIIAMLLCVANIVLSILDLIQRRRLVGLICKEPNEWKSANELYWEKQTSINENKTDTAQEESDSQEKS